MQVLTIELPVDSFNHGTMKVKVAVHDQLCGGMLDDRIVLYGSCLKFDV